ncbi:MAG: diaminopimelate decarboxylase [Bacteroidales bacterium]|jgi:diaminopimelate decarboxylase|nr:diaminopimelate decarboxylase [Bacteroidales bacterium]
MELINHRYCIDGVDVLDLASRYPSPLFVYSAATIERQYRRLSDAFAATRIRLNYACKALQNINILRILCRAGAGLDAVSVQEVRMGLLAGFPPERIVFTPSGVCMEELEEAVSLGVHVTLDSLSLIEKFGLRYGTQVPVFIRINPHVMGGGHLKISTGHKGSKFGISYEQTAEILELVRRYGIQVEGLHMHTGSDILDLNAFFASADIMFRTAAQFPSLRFIDMGSGFKVPYKPDDYQTDIVQLGAQLSARFNAFCQDYGRELTLIFEPGKFMVSEAGYFLTKVNVVKQTPITTFAGINTGLNHLIRPMFYDAYHHIVNASNPEGEVKNYSVVGYICETDTFAWERPLPEIREGDCLVFQNAGAYCFSMASNYNARLRPAEVLVRDGRDFLIREPEVFDDLMRHQIDLG